MTTIRNGSRLSVSILFLTIASILLPLGAQACVGGHGEIDYFDEEMVAPSGGHTAMAFEMKEDSSAWVELDGGNGHLYILTDIDMKRYQEGKKFTYLISIGAPMEQSIDGYGAYIDFKEGKHWVVLENQESNASVTGHVKIYEPALKSECGDPEPTSPNLDELPFFAAPGFPAGLGLVAIAIVAVGVARLR